MSRKSFIFCLICLVMWPASIFVSSQMQSYIGLLLWFFFRKAELVHTSRPVFSVNYGLELAGFNGLLLGLIPTHHIRTWFAHALGRFRYKQQKAGPSDLAPFRPALWAWALPTLFFLLSFILWSPPGGRSVLGSSSTVGARFAWFFGSPFSYNLSIDDAPWFYVRLFFTQPMLFLLAYPVGVWIRHNLPQYPTSEEDPSLIHSAPAPNQAEPTETQIEHGTLE